MGPKRVAKPNGNPEVPPPKIPNTADTPPPPQSAFAAWKERVSSPPVVQGVPAVNSLMIDGVTQISDLSEATPRGKRVIEARIVKVGRDIKFSSNGVDGLMKHLVLADLSGEIQLAMFGDDLVKWKHCINVGFFIGVREFVIRPRSQKSITTHAFDIATTYATELIQLQEPGPEIFFNVKDAVVFDQVNVGSFVDVCGLVTEIHEARQYESCKFQQVTLTDKTGKFTVKLWNSCCDDIQPLLFHIMMVKLGKLCLYNGSYSVDVNPGDFVLIGEEHSAAKTVLDWFESASPEMLNALI